MRVEIGHQPPVVMARLGKLAQEVGDRLIIGVPFDGAGTYIEFDPADQDLGGEIRAAYSASWVCGHGHRHYNCGFCLRTRRAASEHDGAAREEYAENFPDAEPVEEAIRVCDDCHKELMRLNAERGHTDGHQR